uniref:ACHI protein n=1 Tax=Bombyx mori TaxID=7091 RepID=C5IG29_BOMMO|nr:ACHI protein [Bombyx mori]
MLPPTAGLSQEQRDRTEMAFQHRRGVRELTRETIRDARVANRQQSSSPGVRNRFPSTSSTDENESGTDGEAGEGERDKFKCLYLLVETAVAVRQREKEADELPV